MSQVTVITEAVRDEAKKWFSFADRVEPVKAAAESLTLDISAFFIGDANAAMHHRAYSTYQEYMVHILGGAVTEFEQMAAALNKIADAYDDADEIASLNLNQIWSRQSE